MAACLLCQAHPISTPITSCAALSAPNKPSAVSGLYCQTHHSPPTVGKTCWGKSHLPHHHLLCCWLWIPPPTFEIGSRGHAWEPGTWELLLASWQLGLEQLLVSFTTAAMTGAAPIIFHCSDQAQSLSIPGAAPNVLCCGS